VYTSDTFSVRETFFVPVDEPGAIITFEVETEFPLEIWKRLPSRFSTGVARRTGRHLRQLGGGTQTPFFFGEEQKKFVAFLGSPTAAERRREYQTNYSSESDNSFRLGVTEKGADTKVIVLAASVQGRAEAEAAYQHLTAQYPQLLRQSAGYYRDYLSKNGKRRASRRRICNEPTTGRASA